MPRLLKGMPPAADCLHLASPHTQLKDDTAPVVLCVLLSLPRFSAAVDTRTQHAVRGGLQAVCATLLDPQSIFPAGAVVHRPLRAVGLDGVARVTVLGTVLRIALSVARRAVLALTL